MIDVDRIARNSFFNLLNGLISAATSLVLPPILVRAIDRDSFAAWVLVLQLGAYLSYFNLGLQSTISRFVAASEGDQQDGLEAREILNSGLLMLCVLSIIGLSVILAIPSIAPSLLTKVPFAIRSEVSTALLPVAMSFAIAMLLSGVNGYFMGIRRNDQVLVNNVFLKGSVLILLPIAAFGTHELLPMAIVFFICHVFATAHYFLLVKRHDLLLPRSISKRALGMLAKFSIGVSVWSISMLLVNGLAILIVSQFDYEMLGVFSILTSFITVVIGIHAAIFSNLLPEFASIFRRLKPDELGTLVIRSTESSTIVLLLIALPIVHFGPLVLPFWAGPAYLPGSGSILVVLMLGNVLRWTATPYAMHLLASDQQRLGLFSAFSEGIVNAVVSFALAPKLGAMGVAIGLISGAIVGLVANVALNFKRDAAARIPVGQYLLGGLIMPCRFVLPSIAFGCLPGELGGSQILSAVAFSLSTISILGWGISIDTKQRFKAKCLSLMARFSGAAKP